MGYGMVPLNLNELPKFDQIWPLLGLLVNLDELSLAGAHKLFAKCLHARIFVKILYRAVGA